MALPAGFSETAFYRDAHRRLFRAARQLHERQVEIDLLTLGEELRRTGEMEMVGGAAYVASLVDGVPRSVNVPFYAGIVADHAMRRAIIQAAGRTMEAAYAGEHAPADILADLQQAIVEIGAYGGTDAASTVQQLLPILQRRLEEASVRKAPCASLSAPCTRPI